MSSTLAVNAGLVVIKQAVGASTTDVTPNASPAVSQPASQPKGVGTATPSFEPGPPLFASTAAANQGAEVVSPIRDSVPAQ